MARITRSRRKNCPHKACTFHRGRWKLGDHLLAEAVMPNPGDLRAFVYRSWDDAGHRSAYVRVRDGRTWSGNLPLPEQPEPALADAVHRARQFVRTGELVSR